MKRTILIPVILILALSAGALTALGLHKTVEIVIDDQVFSVDFWGIKVSDAISTAGIKVKDGDLVTPQLSDPIHEGQTIHIEPASWVSFEVDGEIRAIWTPEKNPRTLLTLASIHLDPGDQVWSKGFQIDLETPLQAASSHSLQVKHSTEIHLSDGGEVHTFSSSAPTLGDALWDEGYRLVQADRLTPPPNTPLAGETIQARLERSQEVIIRTQGRTIHSRVIADTVGEALAQAAMSLQGLNYSRPAEGALLPADGRIRIVQVREEIILEQEPLPFGLEYQTSAEVPLDTQQVIQVGEYGILARRVRVAYEDDLEVSREVEDQWTAKQPKPRIIAYGAKIVLQTVDTPEGPLQYWRAVEAYATSYSPCRIGIPDKCSSRTASGAELRKGVIGVIRSWYNYMRGARVFIPGYGFATIEDIGGGFSDRHWVDLGYSDADWVRWSQYVTVYFLAPVPSNILYVLE